jgi:hypothetical protein
MVDNPRRVMELIQVAEHCLNQNGYNEREGKILPVIQQTLERRIMRTKELCL